MSVASVPSGSPTAALSAATGPTAASGSHPASGSPLALVTGASGFLGSHIVDELLRRGVRVRCLLRSTSSRRWLEGKPVEYAEGDVRDLSHLDAAVRGAHYIVHAAALTHARTAAEFHEANARGTENIVAAAIRAGDGLQRFAYVSSQAAAGPSVDGAPVTEETTPRPVSPYGRSKLDGEAAVARAAGRIPVVTIRPPTVYGPREQSLYKYFRSVRFHFRPIPGKSRRFSIAYATDTARAIWEGMTRDRAVGEIYFLGGPDVTDYDEMGNAIVRAMKTWAIRVRIPVAALLAGALLGEMVGAVTRRAPYFSRDKFREITAGEWLVSSAKIRSQLGWTPEVSLEEGARLTAAWYREAGWV
ncbi:MAG: NAD-dependent epimerase/dehydratase family protein [Candidatus Latescibacteria bacterium]|nr:NAD-dependent epimerase/dehydratase family protein [Candidatus Latescibacterota bacterium]